MRFAYATPTKQARDNLIQFGGLNKTLTVKDGEFSDMQNMTGDHFPVLSPRERRLKCHTFTKFNGIYGKTHLLWVDGTALYYNGSAVAGVTLADSAKTFVGMGAYVLIFPDKKVFNTATLTVSAIEVTFTTVGDTTYALCDADGTDYTYTSGTNPPTDPAPVSGDYWLDESGEHSTLKVYSETTEEWTAISTTYVKLGAVGIGSGFNQYDGVSISGSSDSQFNGDFVLKAASADYIVVDGLIEANFDQEAAVTVSRTCPTMEYFTESNNRVWGCSSTTHEIYACKLGDPFNWYAFEGLSTDSYAVTVGTDGYFTGAATYQGYPIFFKEKHIHKIMGTQPSNFAVSVTDAPGVQYGSSLSVAMVNGRLLYKGVGGVVAYDGAYPADISKALGEAPYRAAKAGSVDSKYYVSMEDDADAWHLFVFDTETGLWHREDATQATVFTSCQSDTFFVVGQVLWSITRGDKALAFNEEEEGYVAAAGETPAYVTPLPWYAETGDMLWLTLDSKIVSRLQVRIDLLTGSTLTVSMSHDGAAYEVVYTAPAETGRKTHDIRIIPRRCDHFKMKIAGAGYAKVYAISKTVESGGAL